MARAEQAFAEAATISRGAGNVYVTLAATINQTNMQRARGALGLAIATCQQTLDWVSRAWCRGLTLNRESISNLAELLRERNDLEAALPYATKGVERCRQGINLYLIVISSLDVGPYQTGPGPPG